MKPPSQVIMTENHANFGCFHCKSTTHKKWECPFNVAGASSGAARKEVQSEFLQNHPEAKRSQNEQRAQKYFQKQEEAKKFNNTPGSEMVEMMEDQIGSFLNLQAALKGLPSTNHHSLHGGSKLFYEQTLSLQNEMRAELENSRVLVKAAKNREKGLYGKDRQKCQELYKELQETQQEVWKEVTALTVSRRNIHKTVEDLNSACSAAQGFSRDFIQFINGHPEDINYPKHTEQYVETYQRYLKAKGWAEFLNSRTNMILETEDILQETDNMLLMAKNVIDGYPSGEVYCLSCNQGATVHRLACNHGYCNDCKEKLVECILCGSKDVHSLVKF